MEIYFQSATEMARIRTKEHIREWEREREGDGKREMRKMEA